MDPATIGILSLIIEGFNTIQSADAAGQANKIATDQANQEKALIDKANAQAANQENQKQNSVVQATQLAMRRMLAGKTAGLSGTDLTGPSGGASSAPSQFASGKTLLGQ